MHSSLSEIVGFIKYVRPSRLTATVAHGKWNQVEYMRNLLSLHGADVFSSGNQSSGNDSSSISLLIGSTDESNTTQDTFLFSDENDPALAAPSCQPTTTKYDRAAAKFRERYSKRKSIHISTLETLTWYGSSIEELAVPTNDDDAKEQQQQRPKDNSSSRESLQQVSGNNKKAKTEEQHKAATTTPIVICLD